MNSVSKKSTYFFIGRLSDYSAQYQVQNHFLDKENNFVLEVFTSGISVWGSTSMSFEDLRKNVINILDTIIAAYIFQTNKIISYRLEHWVETRDQVSRANMIGWMTPPNTPAKFKSVRSPINTPWKKAANLYSQLLIANPNYAIALQDYSTALSHVNDDSFFYAYRAVEDICRAVTGLDDTNNKIAWEKMHKMLGTSKKHLEPLIKISEEVRHGKRNTTNIENARKRKENMIKISHNFIDKAFKLQFPNF